MNASLRREGYGTGFRSWSRRISGWRGRLIVLGGLAMVLAGAWFWLVFFRAAVTQTSGELMPRGPGVNRKAPAAEEWCVQLSLAPHEVQRIVAACDQRAGGEDLDVR